LSGKPQIDRDWLEMKKMSLLIAFALAATCFAETTNPESNPEIAKIDARLAVLQGFYDEENGIINRLTNFKRKPIQVGTPAYNEFLVADKRMKLIAVEAKALKQKRSAILEAESREIDKESLEDAALAKMTDAEKLEMIEKLKREVGINKESDKSDTESEKANDVQEVDKPVSQTDEIKPQNRPTLDNLSPLRKKLVGYWISSKKVEDPPTYDLDEGVTEADLGEEAKLAKKITENMSYGYSCYGAEAFWDAGEWVPYDEIKENDNIIEIKYTFKNPQFKRTLNERIKIISENEIVALNEGGEFTYRKISEKEWLEKTQGIEWIIEDEALEIASKMPLSKALEK
jgi:hypothetical protein